MAEGLLSVAEDRGGRPKELPSTTRCRLKEHAFAKPKAGRASYAAASTIDVRAAVGSGVWNEEVVVRQRYDSEVWPRCDSNRVVAGNITLA